MLDDGAGVADARRGSSSGMPRRERTKRIAKLSSTAVDSDTADDVLCSAIAEDVGDDDRSWRTICEYFHAWTRTARPTA